MAMRRLKIIFQDGKEVFIESAGEWQRMIKQYKAQESKQHVKLMENWFNGNTNAAQTWETIAEYDGEKEFQ